MDWNKGRLEALRDRLEASLLNSANTARSQLDRMVAEAKEASRRLTLIGKAPHMNGVYCEDCRWLSGNRHWCKLFRVGLILTLRGPKRTAPCLENDNA